MLKRAARLLSAGRSFGFVGTAGAAVFAFAISASAQQMPQPAGPLPAPLPPNLRSLPESPTDRRVPVRVVPKPRPGVTPPQRIWRASPVEPSALTVDIESDSRLPAPGNALPDGLVATASRGDIAAAWYTAPTTRYGHAVLGDAIEAGGLRIRTRDGDILNYSLPETEVFEDRAPRLADLDADGTTEIVTIRSSLREGAAVTVYGLRDGAIKYLASTAFIGTPNRWLNIAGIARFRGGPGQEIVHVRTPHIGGTLIFHAFESGRLVAVARQFGYSNHASGSPEMRLSAIADVNADGRADLALPRADRMGLRIVTLGAGGIRPIAAVPLPAQIDKAIAVQDTGRNAAFLVGLTDGQVLRIGRNRYDPSELREK